MKRFVTVISLLSIFAMGACKKPVLEINDNSIPPLMVSASIHDSLPSTLVNALQIGDVNGLKFKYTSGLHSSYFEYTADGKLLLEKISKLPFSLHASVADTICQRIAFPALEEVGQKISQTEFEHTTFFWSVDRSNVEVFECIKPPYRHTIQIVKNSNRIRHRIEFLG